MLSTSQLASKASGKPFGFGERLREFRQYFPKGGHLKNDASFKYCRFTAYSFGFGATYIGRIRT